MTPLELLLSRAIKSIGLWLIDFSIGINYRAYRRNGGRLARGDWQRMWWQK